MTTAHERKRQGLNLLLKKIKFSPIVSIQGPRQCGKSYLARHLLTQQIKNSEYKSLDRNETREFARTNPRSFLEGGPKQNFIIDEVQKVPALFDEMKDIVDEVRSPGQFIILGSTEFSLETKITEPLTGRISRLRLYPFNLSETLKLDLNPQKQVPFIQNKSRVQRRDLLKYLERGGLPGIFSVRSNSEYSSLISDWIRITTERDLHHIKKFKLDSQIALKIMEQIARLETPSCSEISSHIKLSAKTVQRYLVALKSLFVIIEIAPAAGSAGKSLYYLVDTGLLSFLGASFERKLETWLYLELSSQLSYKDHFNQQLYYYMTPRRSKIHALFQEHDKIIALKLNSTEKVDKRDLLIFEKFSSKFPQKSVEYFYLSGGLTSLKYKNIQIHPWESIC
jgi:predicted AAA+ superfamily ATPase